MMERLVRVAQWMALGLMLAPLAGCAVLADLLNPDMVVNLGIDPDTITSPKGIMLVALHNNTRSQAFIVAQYQVDKDDPSQGAHVFATTVASGEVTNEALECPVGRVEAAGAVVLLADGTQVQVTYSGPPLDVGTAFVCGDVIEVRLSEGTTVATGDQTQQTQYVLSMTVIPGQ